MPPRQSAPGGSGAENRAGETERRILDAVAEILATEDFDSVTMRRVAARAGVSLSTVVRHYGTKDALLAALVDQGDPGHESTDPRHLMAPGDITAAVRAVVDDYEETGPQLMHMLAQEHRYPALSELLDAGRAGHRSWVRWAFAPQLSRRRAARRQRLEDLLVVTTDVYTWKLLRIDARHSADATTAAMTDLCEAVLAP